jgi:hypothetical protein
MAKSLARTITEAITGNGKLDLQTFTVEADPEVIEAKRAEDEAVKRAHDLEDGLPQLKADLTGHDAAFTAACADDDEGKVSRARAAFHAAEDALRGRTERIRRAQLAATAARQKREALTVEAEGRIAEKLRAVLAANVAETRWHATGEGTPSMRSMVELAEEREQIALACDSFSPWGSPTARRIGWFAGMGDHGRSILTGRGAPGLGPHALNSVFLPDVWTQGGCSWLQFLDAARGAGVLEG